MKRFLATFAILVGCSAIVTGCQYDMTKMQNELLAHEGNPIDPASDFPMDERTLRTVNQFDGSEQTAVWWCSEPSLENGDDVEMLTIKATILPANESDATQRSIISVSNGANPVHCRSSVVQTNTEHGSMRAPVL